jgi:Ser-tRNA(Ala) deacylase AlaX
MKTLLIYHTDSYAREMDAQVLEVRGNGVVLDRTVFYFTSGGQPCDFGKLVAEDGSEYAVTDVKKDNGEVLHILDKAPAFSAGAKVHGIIDWVRRYKLMRMHTASHVLATVMHNNRALITGNQIGTGETRFDFSMDEFDRDLFAKRIEEANGKLAEGLDISVSTMEREEAMKIPGIVKLANALPPALTELRIVAIGDFDIQADGGTHVKNTREVGKIVLQKLENKGKSNRRLYFSLEPAE